MKKKITFIMALAMIFSNGVCFAQSGTCGANLTWKLEYTTLTVTGTGGMNNFTNDNISAWRAYKANIKKVIIEDGVSNVGEYAFSDCNNLDTVILGNTLTHIKERSFSGCEKLKKINFPSNLNDIENYAFYLAPLDSVYLPDNVTIGENAFNSANFVYLNTSGTVKNRAFKDNKTLQTIVVRKGIVGSEAFANCENLDSLEIQDGVTEIGDLAFHVCRNLRNVTIPGSVSRIGFSAFYQCSRLNAVDISSGIIPHHAFYGCTNLQSVTLHEGVSRIEEISFVGCKLDSVYLPSTLSYIDSIAFIYINYPDAERFPFGVNENNNYFTSDNGILFNKSKTVLISCPSKKTGHYSLPETVKKIESYSFVKSKLTSIEIPKSVSEIGLYAFRGSGINKVTIPESVTEMGQGVFSYSTITEVTVPKSLKSISIAAFDNCPKLTAVNISEGVTEIGAQAFGDCTGLKFLKLPASVENYKELAFSGCTGLDTVEVKRQTPAWINANVFGRIDLSKVVLVVPDGSKSMYETADVWKDFGTIIEKSKVSNENISKAANFRVFPNPADDYLVVECEDSFTGKELKIFGVNGALTDRRIITETQTRIDISGYPKGIYVINIDGKAVKAVKK